MRHRETFAFELQEPTVPGKVNVLRLRIKFSV